jgi:hypothetical protein
MKSKHVKRKEPRRDLGPLIREHHLRKELAILYKTLSIIGLGGIVIAGGLAMWRWYFAYSHYGPVAISRWTTPALWAVIFFSLVSLFGLLSVSRSKKLLVGLYASGMIYQRGRQQQTILWEEINSIHTAVVRYGLMSLVWGAETTLILYTNNRRKIRLTQVLNDLSSLAETVKHHVYPRLLTEYRRIISQSGSLPFGPLLLTPKGVQRGRDFLSWQDIGKISLRRGRLLIPSRQNQKSSQIRVPVHQVPNIDLCVQLIQHLTTSQA